MGSPEHGDNIRDTIIDLERRALESRNLLLTGATSYGPEGLDVARVIPRRAFRADRSLDEYRKVFGIDIQDVIDVATPSPGPHIVVELGQGVGKALESIQLNIARDQSRLRRGIYLTAECDHFYYKLTTLVRARLNTAWEKMIEKHIRDEQNTKEIKQEFAAALVLYLFERHPELMQFHNVQEADEFLHQKEVWQDLVDTIKTGGVQNIVEEALESPGVPYIPSNEMLRIYQDFAKDPTRYFEAPPLLIRSIEDIRRNTGIYAARTVLGGDMRNYVPKRFRPRSVRVIYDARAVVYILGEPNGTQSFVDLELHNARALQPGGVRWSDCPRGNSDSGYFVEAMLALQRALQSEKDFRSKVDLHLIWGPSARFPKHKKCVPVSMMMTKKGDSGFPSSVLRNMLIRELRYRNKIMRADYTAIPVRDDVYSHFKVESDPQFEAVLAAKNRALQDWYESHP